MKNISRRAAIGSIAAGAMLGSHSQKPEASVLPEAWGDDFITQWSPKKDYKRNITPGSSHIRLSCSAYNINYEKGKSIGDMVKNVRDKGYTACEANDSWKDATDSDIRELKSALKQYDVMFYALHLCINNIHPNLEERLKNQKRVAEMIGTADRLGLKFIVTHTGSCDEGPTKPNRDNWTKETWDTSVKAIKQIISDTSGSRVNLGVEALNPCNINNPKAHIRLREDVGDPRVKVTLDPTNMLNTTDYYRMTELLDTCFELIGEDILYAHAKDVLWLPEMLPSFKWVIPGTGANDYETYLANLSRLKHPRVLFLEFLEEKDYPQAKKFVEDTAEKIGVKIYKSWKKKTVCYW